MVYSSKIPSTLFANRLLYASKLLRIRADIPEGIKSDKDLMSRIRDYSKAGTFTLLSPEGGHGIVYDIGGGRALKLTDDGSEAAVAYMAEKEHPTGI